MHTDSGMTGISLSGYMPYMTVASLEMSDEPNICQVQSLSFPKKDRGKIKPLIPFGIEIFFINLQFKINNW